MVNSNITKVSLMWAESEINTDNIQVDLTIPEEWDGVFYSHSSLVNWKNMSSCDAVTPYLVFHYVEMKDGVNPWDWNALGRNKNFRWDIAIRDMYLIMYYETTNENGISLSFPMLRNIELDPYKIAIIRCAAMIDWFEVSKNKNVTWDLMMKTPLLKWSDKGASLNPNITKDIAFMFPHGIPGKNWHWNWVALFSRDN